jgi:hypothetical protein
MTGRALKPGVLFWRMALLIIVFFCMVLSQFEYDAVSAGRVAARGSGLSASTIRGIDMGFHAAIASFVWIATMPEILDLIFNNHTEYISDEAFVNAIDRRLSYPYAFSILILPAATHYKDGVAKAIAIGKEGVANADPDWRIPYYLATTYFLNLKDEKDALWYYNIAAKTPGIPDYAERFSLNFGIKSSEREKTKELWTTIRDSTNDQSTKDRAQAYIDRLDIFDYLESAAKVYHQRFGHFPATPADLVTGGIIPVVPRDPFGYTFVINKDGTSGIDTNSLPSGTIAQ